MCSKLGKIYILKSIRFTFHAEYCKAIFTPAKNACEPIVLAALIVSLQFTLQPLAHCCHGGGLKRGDKLIVNDQPCLGPRPLPQRT